MVGAILSRITALEVHFAHPLSDVVEEECLKELSRYVTAYRFELGLIS